MRRTARVITVAIAVLLLAAACNWPGGTRTETLAFGTLQQGYYSGITERTAVLITDQAQWAAHWQRHTNGVMPAPALPAVDFSKNALLAVYMGQQRSGGYAVQVTGVTMGSGTVNIGVKESKPTPGAGVIDVQTQPHHLVLIPKVAPGLRVTIKWQ